MKRFLRLGRPTHFQPKHGDATACGLFGTYAKSTDRMRVDCLQCRRTKAWKYP